MDFIGLKNIAVDAALAAGKIIRASTNEDIAVNKKEGMKSFAAQVVTEVDLKCEKVILEHLGPVSQKYDLAILSEETKDDGSRFEKDYFWCIDPMDGTLAFINKYPGFSVSIALIEKDGIPMIGVVYDPSEDNLYYAVKGIGAFKNNDPWEINPKNKHLTYVTDRKLSLTPKADDLQEIMDQYVLELKLDGIKEIDGAGSVLNGIRVLENGPACMMKPPKEQEGGGSIWDYAAIACIFQELSLPATNFIGGQLDLNRVGSCFMNHEGVFFGNLTSEQQKNPLHLS